jgi:hypothetical protein
LTNDKRGVKVPRNQPPAVSRQVLEDAVEHRKETGMSWDKLAEKFTPQLKGRTLMRRCASARLLVPVETSSVKSYSAWRVTERQIEDTVLGVKMKVRQTETGWCWSSETLTGALISHGEVSDMALAMASARRAAKRWSRE